MSQTGTSQPEQAHSKLGETAFPKINGKKDAFIGALRSLKYHEGLVGRVDLEGTVKLHGMHADIVFDIQPEEVQSLLSDGSENSQPGTVKFQSRNREVAPSESQNGWPKLVAYHVDTLFNLKRRMLERFQQKNPHLIIDTALPLIIGGEWIGQNVQRDVGICQLSQRFVILSININGEWQNDAEYADIEAIDARIYNVHRVPVFKVEFDLRLLEEDNPAFEKMQNLADGVENCCPFAAAFGVHNTQGEGIVWKIGTLQGRAHVKSWFKTKGPIASGQKRQPLVQNGTDTTTARRTKKPVHAPKHIAKQQNLSPTDLLAGKLITNRRVDQAFEYLEEMCIDTTSPGNWRALATWLVDDILEEEQTELARLEGKFLSVPGFKVKTELTKSITRIGRDRYFEGLAERKACAVENARKAKTAYLSTDFADWFKVKESYNTCFSEDPVGARTKASTMSPVETPKPDKVSDEAIINECPMNG